MAKSVQNILYTKLFKGKYYKNKKAKLYNNACNIHSRFRICGLSLVTLKQWLDISFPASWIVRTSNSRCIVVGYVNSPVVVYGLIWIETKEPKLNLNLKGCNISNVIYTLMDSDKNLTIDNKLLVWRINLKTCQT